MFNFGIDLAERGWMPDAVLRWGIRRLLSFRLYDFVDEQEFAFDELERFADQLRQSPIAIDPATANDTSDDAPPELFARMLGPRRRFSSGWWSGGVETLAGAEEAMLELTCRRAGLNDGQDVLELGCGWGSLCLWMAERYPRSRITAVTGSAVQREFIEQNAAEKGLSNLQVVTADMNVFDPGRQYDRVLTVEMFERLRNYEVLFARIARWLKPAGEVFVHVTSHRDRAEFIDRDRQRDGLARQFFAGGVVPAAGLLYQFQRDLQIVEHWTVNGRHAQRTLEAWLKNLDSARQPILQILQAGRSKHEAIRQFHRWRLFLIACAEMFGHRNGREWYTSQYRFQHAGATATPSLNP